MSAIVVDPVVIFDLHGFIVNSEYGKKLVLKEIAIVENNDIQHFIVHSPFILPNSDFVTCESTHNHNIDCFDGNIDIQSVQNIVHNIFREHKIIYMYGEKNIALLKEIFNTDNVHIEDMIAFEEFCDYKFPESVQEQKCSHHSGNCAMQNVSAYYRHYSEFIRSYY